MENLGEMGQRLRQARIRAGFDSGRSAALRFKWRTSTYAAHENGQNNFDPEQAAIYGKAFKVSPSWLLTGEGDAPKWGSQKLMDIKTVKSEEPPSADDQSNARIDPVVLGEVLEGLLEGLLGRKPGTRGLAEAIVELVSVQQEYIHDNNKIDNLRNDAMRLGQGFSFQLKQ
jgi:hypothetical protein